MGNLRGSETEEIDPKAVRKRLYRQNSQAMRFLGGALELNYAGEALARPMRTTKNVGVCAQ